MRFHPLIWKVTLWTVVLAPCLGVAGGAIARPILLVESRAQPIRLAQTLAQQDSESDAQPTDSGVDRPSLEPGSSGPLVIELQLNLQKLEFYSGEINGTFNADTEAAVKAFQKDQALPVTGVVAKETWAALQKPGSAKIEAAIQAAASAVPDKPSTAGEQPKTPQQASATKTSPVRMAVMALSVVGIGFGGFSIWKMVLLSHPKFSKPKRSKTKQQKRSPKKKRSKSASRRLEHLDVMPQALPEFASGNDQMTHQNTAPKDGDDAPALWAASETFQEDDAWAEHPRTENSHGEESREEESREEESLGKDNRDSPGNGLKVHGAIHDFEGQALESRALESRAQALNGLGVKGYDVKEQGTKESGLEGRGIQGQGVNRSAIAPPRATPTPPPPPSAIERRDRQASLINPTSRLPRLDIVETLISDLQSSVPAKRRKAIWELGQRADSRAIQPLVNLIPTADSKQRSLILAALSEIGTQTLKPMKRALAMSLQDENAEVRKNAIRDLTRIYDLVGQISNLLAIATEDQDAEVRETARWAMGQLNRIRSNAGIEQAPAQQLLQKSVSPPETFAADQSPNQRWSSENSDSEK